MTFSEFDHIYIDEYRKMFLTSNWIGIDVWVEYQTCDTLELELSGGDNSHVYRDECPFNPKLIKRNKCGCKNSCDSKPTEPH
jgi:hypothetical protein